MGATLSGDGVNFAVFSAHATAMDLCLYSADGRRELARLPFPAREGDVWHIHVSGLEAGQQVVASAQFLIDSEASLRGIMPAQSPGSSAQPSSEKGSSRSLS